jgi:hypothetical protein
VSEGSCYLVAGYKYTDILIDTLQVKRLSHETHSCRLVAGYNNNGILIVTVQKFTFIYIVSNQCNISNIILTGPCNVVEYTIVIFTDMFVFGT